jgi:ribosome-binding protein aMBF1 (putative translation factor)
MPAVAEARPPSVAATPAEPPAEPERADELATDVAKAVRELRLNAGLSERAAARALGTSQTQLRRMEDPRYLPSLRSLARVAAAYGHRLRIAFEAKDRQPVKPAKPAARAKAPRAKRPATRPARATRPRRRP